MNNVLLILRCEFVSLAMLAFVFMYSIVYRKEENKRFTKICLLAIINVAFDGITVYTVNKCLTINPNINLVAHWFFYITSILFTYTYMCYIFTLLLSLNKYKKIRLFLFIPTAIYIIILPFLDVVYLKGPGTYYSMGSAVKIGYAIAFYYLASALVYMLMSIKKAEKIVITILLPATVFAVALLIFQVFVTDFLFTGAVVTTITVAIFFAIENPAAHYMKRAYIDFDTGVKNRNCYDEDVKKLNKIYFESDNQDNVGCVVCDLNGLKSVNDNFGHIVGDEMIRTAAQVISSNFKSANSVYRIGGDEFVAIYKGEFVENMNKEIEQLQSACENHHNEHFPLGIATGVADREESAVKEFSELVIIADKRMYENKMIMKSQT